MVPHRNESQFWGKCRVCKVLTANKEARWGKNWVVASRVIELLWELGGLNDHGGSPLLYGNYWRDYLIWR